MDFRDNEDPENPDYPNDKDDPIGSNNTDDPNWSDHDTSVKGMYNPVTGMGGANTGDTTNLMYYMGISLLSLSLIFFIVYKRESE